LTTKKIYLIRHGQTELNRQGIVQGSGVDAPLNAEGMRQRDAFFNAYRHVAFDKVYTSVLQRTVQSVQPFLDRGLPHEALPGLNEISWGVHEGKTITPEEDAYYHWMLAQWQGGRTDLKIEGGESPEDVALRQRAAWQRVVAQPVEQTILVCMHGRAMRILLTQILQYPLRAMDLFEHQNLCLYLLHGTGSMFRVEQYNCTAHLRLAGQAQLLV
jgi:probable phosphoglycerate mutase